jgi:son of sevenless-like protein
VSKDSRPVPKRPSFPLSSLPSRSDSEPSFRSSRFSRQPETLFIPGNEISEADKLSSNSPSTPRSDSHFGSQGTFSSYGSPSTVRSAISTDSGIHIPKVVSEAVTDRRSIVKLSAVGNVISGTLEGLVGRLINNFSEYFTMV